jgi:hypothetical protein
MSILHELYNRAVTTEEMEIQRHIFETHLMELAKKDRVIDYLKRGMGVIERKDKFVSHIFMSAEDYGVLLKHFRKEMEPVTDVSVLRTGKMAEYNGTWICVSKLVKDPEFYAVGDTIPEGYLLDSKR